MAYAFADIAFTPAVRDQQDRLGAGAYAKFLSAERDGGATLGERETEFIQARDGFYQASVSETGWPYVQFRGGPGGFLQVLNDRTIAYADLRGNRQYISLGNLSVNNRVSLILVDYLRAERLKIWGHVKAVEPTAAEWLALPADLRPEGAERLICISIDAFDWNCPRNIPRRYTTGEAVQEIDDLTRENAKLRAELSAVRTARPDLSQH
jgi:uncharacterized protein